MGRKRANRELREHCHHDQRPVRMLWAKLARISGCEYSSVREITATQSHRLLSMTAWPSLTRTAGFGRIDLHLLLPLEPSQVSSGPKNKF
jgi:hypothetical protein